jgi:hypothetical protein
MKQNILLEYKNSYCAFWIYNKNEFSNFINGKYYNINNIPCYDIREKTRLVYTFV